MDKTEFSRKVMEVESTLYHVSKSILHNETDCEDAVQEAILKAYTKRNTLKEVNFFKTWLTRILINECYQLLRTKKQEISYDVFMQEKPIEDKNNSELYYAIKKLDIKHRIPIVLCYIEGYKVSEIAHILKIPTGTVKSRLSKGRNQIKLLLEDEVQR